MTFKEWETIESIKKSCEDSKLNDLFGSAYSDTITDEIREYNKNIMITLIEQDLYQIAAALNKIAETMPKVPEASSRGEE